MKTVITYDTFDLFHVGHLRILTRAKALGNRLIVAVSTDEFNFVKGKSSVIPYASRAEIVAGLSCIDQVILEENWDQKISDIKKWSVDVFVMGHDWDGKFGYLSDYCEVTYLDRTSGVSSTMIKRTVGASSSSAIDF